MRLAGGLIGFRRLCQSEARPSPSALVGVHNTIHRFFHVLDGLEAGPRVHTDGHLTNPGLGNLFLEDGEMHVEKVGLVLQGREDISAWCQRMREGWAGAPTLHAESNIVLSMEGGLIVNRSCWSALIDGAVASYGTHDDVLETVRCEESDVVEWRFRKRIVRHLWAAKP
jgi:hypothetical protein